MRVDDGQLLAIPCHQREDVFSDPADDVVDPRILCGWWLPCGSSSNGETTPYSDLCNRGFCDHESMTSWPSSLCYRIEIGRLHLVRVAMCLTVPLLSEFSDGKIWFWRISNDLRSTSPRGSQHCHYC